MKPLSETAQLVSDEMAVESQVSTPQLTQQITTNLPSTTSILSFNNNLTF